MTEDQFHKTNFKSYKAIDYTISRLNHGIKKISCMLLAVDFENRLLKLVPFDADEYRNEEFWAHADHCEVDKSTTNYKEKTKLSIPHQIGDRKENNSAS